MTSTYTDFEVRLLYNMIPSEYDQERFRNYMKELYGEDYNKDLKAYLKKAKDQ